MTYKLRRQSSMLPAQQVMAVGPTPLIDCDQCAGKPALGRCLPHHILALARLPPGMGEAEKVEWWRLASWLHLAASWAEVDEARLIRMKHKPIPSKPLAQDFQSPLGIAVLLEGHHKVISIAHERTASRKPGLHFVLEPLVQHMMQEDVREHW